jgi:hypothetical protein
LLHPDLQTHIPVTFAESRAFPHPQKEARGTENTSFLLTSLKGGEPINKVIGIL